MKRNNAIELVKDEVRGKVYPPDFSSGYYRATRFDHAGMLYELSWRGHQFFGEWFDVHDPYKHDSICGPVDEFGQIGYETADCGGEFLKIGVGVLRKSSDEPYDRFKAFEVVDSGMRTTECDAESIRFLHELHSDRFSYAYTKTLRLRNDPPGFDIHYELRNLGKEDFHTNVYNHNFFVLDAEKVGPNLEIDFPFQPEGDWREAYEQVKLCARGIRFSRELKPGESVFMGNLHGFEPGKEGFDFQLKNTRTQAGVQVKGTGVPSHIVFWASPRVPCVEPYVSIDVAAGKAQTWKLSYTLFE